LNPEHYHRAKELFLGAVEIETSKRATWIDEQCGSDETLKNRVQSLLNHDDTQTLLAPQKIVGDLASASKKLRSLRPLSGLSKTLDSIQKMPPRGLMAVGALAVLLPVLISGWIANRALDGFRDHLRAASLVDLVDSKATAIRFWLGREKTVVQSWADSTKVRQLVTELIEIAKVSKAPQIGDQLRSAPQQTLLDHEMETLAGHSVRYAVWDKSLTTIADWSPTRSSVGVSVTPKGAERLTAVMANGPTAVVIGPKDAITRDYGDMPTKPIVAVIVPVTNDDGEVIGTMMVGNSEGTDDLGDFLSSSLSDYKATDNERSYGGTFVFDRAGMLLYDSPYDAELRTLGLIPANEDSFSAKQLELRDPGVDLTRGRIAAENFAARPLTKMVRMAVSNGSGVDVTGYRDVRGVTVAGAWRWLDDYQFGVGIEVDKQALEPGFWIAQLQSWAMLGLVGISLCVAGYSMLTIRRLRESISTSHRIGPYVLEQMVGEGGMGRVYRARHDLLKRPTAIKLLRPELLSESSMARFQREAQLAARLEHPNTVSVFDFGLSDDKRFYLVMEWIDGVTLDRLVQQEGRIKVERAIAILRQIAMSLREAHVLGLIHRDLKPQNIMLTQRASESDVVKVLDFGLARDLRAEPLGPNTVPTLTELGFIAGTPRYMAPERWNAATPVSPAIDVFAFGCIAYFILTGRHLIQGKSIEEICANVLQVLPGRPSAIAGNEIPKGLDELTMRCTEPNPAARPAGFDAVLEMMDHVGEASLPAVLLNMPG